MHADPILVGNLNHMAAGVSVWLLTYLLHSTLLIGTLWLLLRWRPRMSVRTREGLWRTALLGGLATASVQLAVGWEPWSGRLHVTSTPALHAAPPMLATPARPPLSPPYTLAAPATTVIAAPPAPATTSPAEPLHPLTCFAALWLLGLVLGSVRAHRHRAGLRRRLATRRPLVTGPLPGALARLQRGSGVHRPVRLTAMPGLGSPLAVGIFNPEIVVPARASFDLTAAHRDAMLAHELAHHVRRDLLWLAIARGLNILFFFQPLGLLVGRRLRETSEMLADDWAAGRTGHSRDLAECLTVVAGWLLHPRRVVVPAMAASGALLERRVQRLLDEPGPTASRRMTPLLAALPLVAVAFLAPSVAARPSTATTEPPVTDTRAAPSEGASLDAELAALTNESALLLDLLDRIEKPAPALVRAAARLRARLSLLHERRLALGRAAPETKR